MKVGLDPKGCHLWARNQRNERKRARNPMVERGCGRGFNGVTILFFLGPMGGGAAKFGCPTIS